MKNQILIVDPLSEPGHGNFNSNFLDLLKEKDITLLASKHCCSNLSFPNNRYIPESLLRKNNRILYSLNQILILFYAVYFARRYRFPKVVFISYDIISFPLVSHLFSNNVYVLEHNTIEPKKRTKLRLFNWISSKVTHICLSEYITNFVKNDCHKKAITINHPIKKWTVSAAESSTTLAFMPSTTVDEDTRNLIVKQFVGQDKFVLYTKGKSKSSKQVIFQPRYDDYFEMIDKSKFIIIPQLFDYRVSGVFFEAIGATDTLIIMYSCVFSENMKKIFPNNVVIVKDWSNLMFDISEHQSCFQQDETESVIKILNEQNIENVTDEFFS